MRRIAFTCGDINGIGPEIAIKAINRISSQKKNRQLILIIPENVFKNANKLAKADFNYRIIRNTESIIRLNDPVLILIIKSFKQKIGEPTYSSGKSAYLALKTGFDLLQKKLSDALVTAPVSKTALKLAGVKYPGQTEMFADWCGVRNFVMVFLSRKLKVGLYSIHIPLKDVPKSLNKIELSNKFEVIISTLKNDLGIDNPTIAVLGLNPHAGENGIIGNEEQTVLKPVIEKKKYFKVIEGPFSADAFFAQNKFMEHDFIFGLYHDQVLIPFKYINPGTGVNYTAGLPIIRTSPDHGTAYDIAGKGIASESSMLEAFKYAEIILKNRKKSRLNQ